ncbi:MAG: lipocalin family protein [Candidatus Omnitrophica bacterium]|nr:lipocalin family protein [Candidatus Omnitrophota bacterium]
MIIKRLFVFLNSLLMVGCAHSLPSLKTVDHVDIQRYMGPWYVIACIPTPIETKAYNAIEEYQLKPDGTINTIFTFHKGGFDGPLKKYNPRGFIVDKVNNSTWRMQFIWPFKAEYLITYLTPDYSQTVIGRNKRDYFWIMARTPKIPDADYQRLLNMLAAQGYDITKVRKVPQRWSDKE